MKFMNEYYYTSYVVSVAKVSQDECSKDAVLTDFTILWNKADEQILQIKTSEPPPIY